MRTFKVGDEVVVRGVVCGTDPPGDAWYVSFGRGAAWISGGRVLRNGPGASRFKVGDRICCSGARGPALIEGVMGDTYDVLFSDGSRGNYSTAYIDRHYALAPATADYAVGDFIGKRGEALLDSREVLSIGPLTTQVRYANGATDFLTNAHHSWVKCDDQDACRRAHAIARVERAQERVSCPAEDFVDDEGHLDSTAQALVHIAEEHG